MTTDRSAGRLENNNLPETGHDYYEVLGPGFELQAALKF